MGNKYNVVSYRTAKRLYEAGVKLDTDFVYKDGYLLVGRKSIYFDISMGFLKWFKKEDALAAPTFIELWDALPKYIIINGKECEIYHTMDYDREIIGYRNSGYYMHGLQGLTEAAAELLLLLKAKNFF